MLSRVAHLRRPLVMALSLALVYQAGACPCGCWDESIWQALLGDASCWLRGTGAAGHVDCADEPAGSSDDRPVPVVAKALRTTTLAATDEHSHCDAEARITGQQPLLDLRAAAAGGYGPTPPPLALALSTRLKLRSAQNWQPAEARADARAFLQVFLL